MRTLARQLAIEQGCQTGPQKGRVAAGPQSNQAETDPIQLISSTALSLHSW